MCDEINVLEAKNNEAITALLQALTTNNSLAPPPAQVEDAEMTIIKEPNKRISFLLPKKTGIQQTNWARRKAKQQHKSLRKKAKKLIKEYSKTMKLEDKRRIRRMNGPTIVPDSGATSTCIRKEDEEFVKILNENSPKRFQNANGTISEAGKKARLPFEMRHPATDADTVPDIANNPLLSTSKTADANYVTVFTKDDVRVFDAETAPFEVTGKVVLEGWRCPETGLWRIPLKQHMDNPNTDTALLTQKTTDIILKKRGQCDPNEFANSVYELPNLEQVVAWYHAAAGYPTKATWLKAIEAGFYTSWPLLTAKAVKKHFPETPETSQAT
jgi:hypothetical protein